jgi:hypothetical protein
MFDVSSIRGVKRDSCGEKLESKTRSDRDESFRKIEFRKKLIRSKQSENKKKNQAKVGLNR